MQSPRHRGSAALLGPVVAFAASLATGTAAAQLPPGSSCSSPGQCDTGYCVDGVCCAGACTGACEACDVPGLAGLCSVIPAGETPHGARPPCDDGDGNVCNVLVCDGTAEHRDRCVPDPPPECGTWTLAPEHRAVSELFVLDDTRVLGLSAGGTAAIFDITTDSWSAPVAVVEGASAWVVGVLLDDGRVLLSGALDGAPHAAFLDPASMNVEPTTPSPDVRNRFHIALADGRALFVGSEASAATAMIFDPVAETWSFTGSVSGYRPVDHSIVRLLDGRVMVGPKSSVPTTTHVWNGSTWVASEPGFDRADGRLTVLPDGRVFATGGFWENEAAIFSPWSNTWTPMAPALARHDTTLNVLSQVLTLPSGRVVVTGGGMYANTRTTEVFDPQLNAWSFAEDRPFTSSWPDTSTVLPDGRVMLVTSGGTAFFDLEAGDVSVGAGGGGGGDDGAGGGATTGVGATTSGGVTTAGGGGAGGDGGGATASGAGGDGGNQGGGPTTSGGGAGDGGGDGTGGDATPVSGAGGAPGTGGDGGAPPGGSTTSGGDGGSGPDATAAGPTGAGSTTGVTTSAATGGATAGGGAPAGGGGGGCAIAARDRDPGQLLVWIAAAAWIGARRRGRRRGDLARST